MTSSQIPQLSDLDVVEVRGTIVHVHESDPVALVEFVNENGRGECVWFPLSKLSKVEETAGA